MASSFLLVGLVRRPHGVRGEVSVEVVTSFPERFAPGARVRWSRGGQERTLTIRAARPHGPRMLLAFEGIVSPEEAASLSGGELDVPEEEAVVAPEGFYYSHEIAGWACEDPSGKPLGTAVALEPTSAGALLSIESPSGKEVLVPFAWPIVASVDRERRVIVLDPPEGLMEL